MSDESSSRPRDGAFPCSRRTTTGIRSHDSPIRNDRARVRVTVTQRAKGTPVVNETVIAADERPAGGLHRRQVVKGIAWSVPVLTASAALPRSAASTVPCVPVTFSISPDQTTAPDPQTISLSTVGADGSTYVVTITSAISATTTIGQANPTSGVPYTSYNLSTAGNGWVGNGGPDGNDGSTDYVFSGFLPPTGSGAIVLNQRAAVDPEPTGSTPLGPDQQTLTFTITKDGTVIDPANLSLDVFDISSYEGESPTDGNWRGIHWDAVGFSTTPSTIAFTGTAGVSTTGTGSGSLADPYHRTGSQEATPPDGFLEDRFTFATFPSGTTMQYTSFDGMTGWHFIAISGITFDLPNCP